LYANCVKAWGTRQITEITPADVKDLLKAITKRGSPMQANTVLMYFKAVCEWAMPDVLLVNPCHKIKQPHKETERDRVLTDQELVWLWEHCETETWPYGAIGQMLIVTMQRPGQVAAMKRSHIKDNIWSLPSTPRKNKPSETKSGRKHWVWLTALALQIKDRGRAIKDRDMIFSTTGKKPDTKDFMARCRAALCEKAKAAGLPEPEQWSLRDIRRTVLSKWVELGIALEVREAAMNHTTDKLRRTYEHPNLNMQVRAAFELWSKELERIVATNRQSVLSFDREVA